MRLNRIFVQHFKGLEKLEVNAEGKNITVRGKNGTGKTTIADAYAWLMTGKGFDGKAIDTQIKKRGEDGSTPSDGGVEHTVEAEFSIDENHFVTLKREFKEKWEKHRGAAESEFKGHTTTYSIDGVPMSKKEYERRVSDLVKGDTFSVLSMPLHFCTNTKWQDRRKVLMMVCGTVTDADVIEANAELHPLKDLLTNGRTVEDLRKVLQSKMKKTNEETKGIPARIDELTRTIPDKPGEGKELLESEIADLEGQKAEKQKQLLRIENGGEVAEREKELAGIEAKMTKRKAELEGDDSRKRGEAERVVRGCESELERIGRELEEGQKQKDRLQTAITTSEKIAADLRAEWGVEKKKELEADTVSEVCPYCGQPLPPDKLAEARQKAADDFNVHKAEKLKAISEKGKRIMEQRAADLEKVKVIDTQATEKEARIEELSSKLKEARAIVEVPASATKAEDDAAYKELLAEKARIKTEIADLRDSGEGEAIKVKMGISQLDLDISTRREKLVAIKQAASTKARIEELKEHEAELGRVYSELEGQLFLTEEFMRAKVRATEDGINSHFKYVRWKMFTQRINGALEECCEPLIDGVPFSDGLNKGNRMKAALDIVNTLSEYYGVKLPVIIDDCESYTSLPDIGTQVIKLIADGAHDTLDVEIED